MGTRAVRRLQLLWRTWAGWEAATPADPDTETGGPGKEGLGAAIDAEPAWVVYLHQPAVRVALADALLYLTVMSCGLLMTAYLKWLGLTEAVLALWRGVAAFAGIAATAVFPAFQRSKGEGSIHTICYVFFFLFFFPVFFSVSFPHLLPHVAGTSLAVSRGLSMCEL